MRELLMAGAIVWFACFAGWLYIAEVLSSVPAALVALGCGAMSVLFFYAADNYKEDSDGG